MHSQVHDSRPEIWTERRSGQVREEGPEGAAAVAEGVLLGVGHLGEGAAVALVGDDDGVVAEAADPPGLGRHLALDRAVVGGLSLGGGIATRFALKHPDRVRALVVVDSSSAAGLPLSVDNVVMRARSIQVVLEGGMNAMAEFAIASNPNVSGRLKLDPRAREEVFAMYRMLKPVGYANALRALLQMDYITERLPEIAGPTLLVCGD